MTFENFTFIMLGLSIFIAMGSFVYAVWPDEYEMKEIFGKKRRNDIKQQN